MLDAMEDAHLSYGSKTGFGVVPGFQMRLAVAGRLFACFENRHPTCF